MHEEACCYHCDKVILAVGPAVKLTAHDGSVYILHLACAEQGCSHAFGEDTAEMETKFKPKEHYESGELIEDETLYELFRHKTGSACVDLHAIYAPEENLTPCFSAAVDLFEHGLTFRVYFNIQNDTIEIIDLKRWWFG